jgi:hypothetical protein
MTVAEYKWTNEKLELLLLTPVPICSDESGVVFVDTCLLIVSSTTTTLIQTLQIGPGVYKHNSDSDTTNRDRCLQQQL